MTTAREWRKIAAHLPRHNGPGKPRQDDRRFVSAFFFAAACNCSLESLPAVFGNPRSLRTRRQRWERDGTLARLLQAGAPVIARMKHDYWGAIHDASDVSSPAWKPSSAFFGEDLIPRLPGVSPRGQYLTRQKQRDDGENDPLAILARLHGWK
ncbi:transposase [Bradyrhizobium sp. McL0616]|uniref:transposase n=1 Tax=Bradyrhizobium sp. McL0616 TaxID=3415674 RepID=UPI003CECE055